MLIDDNTYVYCTKCKYFRLDDEDIPYCLFEDECDIYDCEDSRKFKDRPYYKQIILWEWEEKCLNKQGY